MNEKALINFPETDTPDQADPQASEATRPFRLVKYFSITGFGVIMVFTLVLTAFISYQANRIIQAKSDDFARLLASHIQYQVFIDFVLPTAVQGEGRVSLGDEKQYQDLDQVIRNTIHSFNVKRVNLYSLDGYVLYSTDMSLVRSKVEMNRPMQTALEGEQVSVLITEPGKSLTGLDKRWTLRIYFPLRVASRLDGPVGNVLGIFEVDQDLTDEYAEITKFQYLSVAISVGFAALIFIILRQIIVRGERIIDQRNQERRRLEQKLHHSERLATLGQMVAAVSHEIRNPLGIISSTAEILQGKIKTYEPNNQLAEIIVEESRRLNGIVTEFLDFARPQTPKITDCSLEDVLEKNLSYLAPSLEKSKIEIIRNYNGPQKIPADPELLYQAFLNVFINAIQAMPEGGTLEVRTDWPQEREGDDEKRVEIVIADTGIGIDPEKLKSLFNPFFTTKNRGSGLGLAIVRNIIESHKGTVAIEPRPDKGTRLLVHLPTSLES